MAVGWSPAGSNSDCMTMRMPPSDFSGRAGRCGVQISPFLCSGLPLSISFDSASTVAVTPDWGRDSASSRLMSRPATGFRPAADRSLAEAAPPIEVPRAVRVGAAERSGIFFVGLASRARAAVPASPRVPAEALPTRGASIPCPSRSASRAISSAQSAIDPDSGAPLSAGCGASAKPLRSSGSAASR